MTPSPTDPMPGAPHAASRRCPRCGARLGVLTRSADADPPADALYCGCCGLVVPAH